MSEPIVPPVARGGNPIHDALEDGWDHLAHVFASHVPHHMHASPATAVIPATVETLPPKGTPVQLATDLHTIASKLEPLAEDTLDKVSALVGSPVGAAGFDMLHQLVHLNIDPAVVQKALGGLEALLQAYAPAAAQQPAQAPAA